MGIAVAALRLTVLHCHASNSFFFPLNVVRSAIHPAPLTHLPDQGALRPARGLLAAVEVRPTRELCPPHPCTVIMELVGGWGAGGEAWLSLGRDGAVADAGEREEQGSFCFQS